MCCALLLLLLPGATELALLFKNLGTPLSYEKVADVFMRYDKDESGQIEFGEFLLMFQVRSEALAVLSGVLGQDLVCNMTRTKGLTAMAQCKFPDTVCPFPYLPLSAALHKFS
jgi:hypothetical protein